MNNFRIEVEISLPFSDQHRNGIEEAIHHCLIDATLLNPPKIALEVKTPVIVND
jgi:hypothetical protein